MKDKAFKIATVALVTIICILVLTLIALRIRKRVVINNEADKLLEQYSDVKPEIPNGVIVENKNVP